MCAERRAAAAAAAAAVTLADAWTADYNSVFPMGVNVAATWDRGLAYARGQAMGYEHKHKGTSVQLGPVTGPLGREPEGGRNWEGWAPDPMLSGQMFAQTIAGIQSQHVIACGKHFIAYEQEHFRQPGDGFGYPVNNSYSSNLDDVTMHELYLWPWADGVRAGLGSIMCSYNQINNSYACQNSYTLNKLLKSELGFQGFVMSDWSAQMSGIGSALAGLDMSMPGDIQFNSGTSYWGSNLTVAVLNGTVPQWRLDDMAVRILSAWYYVGVDTDYTPINFDAWTLLTYGFQHYYAMEDYTVVNEHVDVRDHHGSLIREIGAASTVLLKNEGVLPLTGYEKFTGIFGEDAGPNNYGPNGCSDRGCDNGTLACGWGSGSANFPYLITPAFAIQEKIFGNDGIAQAIFDNYAYADIVSLAQQSTVAIVFVNADSGEGYIDVDGNIGDRNNLTLWHGGDDLIQNVTSGCNNTIVVIHSVGAVLLDSFYDNPNVTAILWAGVPGEQSGYSITDVLYGDVNPGGKLPFTMGFSRENYGTDVLYRPNNGYDAPQVNFDEGVFIDYRAFDRFGVDPIYPFGFGLSYTNFSYSNLAITKQNAGPYTPTTGYTIAAPEFGSVANDTSDYLFPANFSQVKAYIYPYLNSTSLSTSANESDYGVPGYVPSGSQDGSAQPFVPAGGEPGGNPQLFDILYTVTATVTNTGKVAGDEVAQLYVGLGGPNDPKVQLRGFERLSIGPGQSATFTVDLTRRDLSSWNVVAQNWLITNYTKTVYVGASSRDLPLQQCIEGADAFNG